MSILTLLKSQTPWGVPATHPQLDEAQWQVPEPEYDKYGAASTLNQTGSMIAKFDPIVQAFVEFADQAELPLLDVGAGFGVATIPALAQGATVIANDMDERHLLTLRQQTPISDRQRLYLNIGMYPQDLEFPAQTFDGIMMRRIIHFLTADKMPAVFTKAAYWLRPGGRLFIVCMTPYHQYIPEFIKEYDARWQAGILWPGIIPNLRLFKPDLDDDVPDFIHVMDERPLAQAIQPYFELKMSLLFDYQPGPILEHHRAFYGLVAERNDLKI